MNPRGNPFFAPNNAAHYGHLGGRATTRAKAQAARRNGKKRKKAHALFSSRSVEWETPSDLYKPLGAEFAFTLDVCATPHNAKVPRFFARSDDGLAQSWQGERCWMNPPYGRDIARWVAKAYREATAGALVVALLPARTDTRWWQQYVTRGEIRFLPGRLRFGGAKHAAPFPSAIVVWRAGMNASNCTQ